VIAMIRNQTMTDKKEEKTVNPANSDFDVFKSFVVREEKRITKETKEVNSRPSQTIDLNKLKALSEMIGKKGNYVPLLDFTNQIKNLGYIAMKDGVEVEARKTSFIAHFNKTTFNNDIPLKAGIKGNDIHIRRI